LALAEEPDAQHALRRERSPNYCRGGIDFLQIGGPDRLEERAGFRVVESQQGAAACFVVIHDVPFSRFHVVQTEWTGVSQPYWTQIGVGEARRTARSGTPYGRR
jgi:hypothetical protein